MIAKSVPAREGTRTFATGIAYVQKHEHRRQPELVGVGISFDDRVSYASADEKTAWTHARGVSSVAAAAREMEAVAALSRRCADPVHHEIIAYAKHEQPTREQMVADAERLLTALDMADHQYVMSVHTDTDDLHAHVIVNRVGPDGKANARWNERIIRERTCAQIAAERGWSIVVGFHNRDIVQEHLGLEALPPAPTRRAYEGDVARAHGSGVLPWEEAARPYVLEAVERATSWDDLRARLDAHGVVLKAVERGGRFQGLAFAEGLAPDAPGCGASRIDAGCKLAALQARFGPYHAAGMPARFPRPPERGAQAGLWHEARREVILAAVDMARSWNEVEYSLRAVCGVRLKVVESEGRAQGLAFAAGPEPDAPGCAASLIDDRCKLSVLEARFGPLAAVRRTMPHLLSSPLSRAHVGGETSAHERTAAPVSPEVAPAASVVREEAAREPLRARIERETPGAGEAGSWALERARGIAENARLREEYGRYREAFSEQRRETTGERRAEAWSEERARRQAESARRWEAKQAQRAFVRAVVPRGVLRNTAYGVVEHAHQRRVERDRAQAHTRWEQTKTQLAREHGETALAPLRYRDYVALREAATLTRATIAKPDAPETARVPPTQKHRLASHTVEEVRGELRARMVAESKAAYADPDKLQVFPPLEARYKHVDGLLRAYTEQGGGRLLLAPDNGANTRERLEQVERGVTRAAAERTEVREQERSLRAETAHEQTVAGLGDQPYEVLRAELGECSRRLTAQEGSLGRERAMLRGVAQAPELHAGAEIGAARNHAIAEAEDGARSYTPAEWDMHDEIARRTISRNPLKHIGLERLKTTLAEAHAERIDNAKERAASSFERSGEGERIAERCRVANEERAQARERLDAIAREKGGIADARAQVTNVLGALEYLERERIPAPRVVVDRTASPADTTRRIGERITVARANVGFERHRVELGGFEKGLRQREAALGRELKGLGYAAEPRPLEEQKRQGWDRACGEARQAAALTVAESHRLYEARMHLEDWNPLTRLPAERTERGIMQAHATREREALERAYETFTKKEEPRLARVFAEQRQGRENWEARRDKIAEGQREVQRGVGAVAAAREDLQTMERAGVPWRELDRVMEGSECTRAEGLRERIGEAKGALLQEVGVGALQRALEPIADGRAWGYDAEERKSAGWILERLNGVKPDAHVCAARDMHQVVRAPEHLAEQGREHMQRERNAERAREREIERSQDRGISMGW